jgi:hypothetical protein
MYIFAAQFDTQRGPDAVNTYKITLAIDETQMNEDSWKFLQSKKGQTYLLIAHDVKELEKDSSFSNPQETVNETKRRLQKRLHSVIAKVAEEKNKKPDEVKEALKKMLIDKGYMEESTSELSVDGYAAGIYLLENEFD